MSGSYIECPQCGKRALSVATRCPGCGAALPARPLDGPAGRPGPVRLGPAITVGGVLVLAAVLVLLGTRGSAPPPGQAAPPPPSEAAPAAADSSEPTPPDEQPTASPPGQPSPSTTPETLAPAGTPAQAAGSVRRYARTWTNIRSGRGRSTPSLGVLNPGDAVQADSLVRGWYRVTVDGRPIGYVHRSMLVVTPTAIGP
jgi:hypothetical protein